MKSKTIVPIKRLNGEITMPGDKSISHRAVMVGAIAKGKTTINGLLDCDDTNYTIRAFEDMGVEIRKKESATIITGNSLRGLKKPKGPIYLGNSGTSMRILSGILAGQGFETKLVGDKSLSNRPMGRVAKPLSLMGVDIKTGPNSLPPLVIKGGKVKPMSYRMPIPSAQVKSAILFAGLYADGVTTVEEEFKSRDHTERMLKYFGSNLKVENLKVSMAGGGELRARDLEIPGDVSSASFFIVGAAILKGSEIALKNVGINPTRAGILKVLSRMGVELEVFNKRELFEPVADIRVRYSGTKGVDIEEQEMPSIIDEIPIIFVLAALSRGTTRIRGAQELRVKETDRIKSMKENLEKMGAKFRIDKDDIIIDGVAELKGANLKSFDDHRTCMSMAIAALAAKGESVLDDIDCVSKSFPGFFETLEKLKK